MARKLREFAILTLLIAALTWFALLAGGWPWQEQLGYRLLSVVALTVLFVMCLRRWPS